jgi:hypothetical protein
MKIAIHQPEHFPYMGFFKKMEFVDLFIILDDAQYTKNNWQNRNRFLNKNKVEEFFTVQVEKNASKKSIKDVLTVDGPWRFKNPKKLKQNFNVDLKNMFTYKKLIDINMESIRLGTKLLNINTPILFSSMFNIKSKGTQRLVDICSYTNATEYVSGLGGKSYLDESLFGDIKLTYYNPPIKNYYSFINNI